MNSDAENEFRLIEHYFKNLTPLSDDVVYGIGDDAAVMSVPPGHELVVSTDTLVNGIHFPDNTAPYDIGFKALAVNLSDIAAMGAEPRWATLCLTLPKIDKQWLQEFSRGFAEPARRYNVSLVGGDTTHGPLSISVQIMGTVKAGMSLTRAGANVGDHIFVTGTLGAAALALSVLQNNNVPGQDMAECLSRLNRPLPRVEVGRAINGIATAAIDISDGLAADLGHILESSAASAIVELGQMPVCTQLQQITDVDRYWQLAIASGDDYELCFTVPEESVTRVARISKELDVPITNIGRVVEGQGDITWLNANGEALQPGPGGYRHF